MKKWGRVFSSLLSLLLVVSSLGFAAGPPDAGSQSYLIGLRPGASAKGLAIAGLVVKSEWAELGAAHVVANSAAAARLQSHGMVTYVEEDRPVSIMSFSDGTYTYGLQAVRAVEAWGLGYKGAGLKVCVIDTGIDYNHPAFVRNGVSIIKDSKNFHSDGKPTAADGNGHGTHVAGTVAGQGNGSGSYIGVAPDVDLYIARVLGDDGTGSTSGIINAVNWCVDTVKANIANLSLGSSRSNKTEQSAFDSAYNKGMLSIAAAGNAGSTATSYPAGYTSVVSVAAVDSSLVKASFSQYNKTVELAAPGVAVLSSVPLGTGLNGTASEDGTNYANNPIEFAGTGSVSGPYVECGLANSTSSCVNKPASGPWIAMIDRGSISFADKATNVMAQGASAAVLANNDTAAPNDVGSFTFGASGAWIPTVSVSYNSGVAIRSGGLGSGTVSIGASDYAYFNGTSMASPHAAAVAALAWSAKPTLTNATVRTILQNTAYDLGASGRDNLYGYGLVQADAAVSAALAATNDPPPSTGPGKGGGKPK